ncbi:unnamed protein product [Oppiella nova]|uniref:Very long-chain fatty acid transport protein n=1 Tax=Oppiella nova TaxID=334625 RepID=A0A7R9MCH8_9ACAR|nr:unnamed protein product [Oppiella nova]CAG2174847.1 unnamed protein product [Oppiella nova]
MDSFLIALLIAYIISLLFHINPWLRLCWVACLIISFIGNYWHPIRIFWLTLPRDLKTTKLLPAKFFLYKCKRHNKSVPKVFKEIAFKYPNRVMFYYRDDVWTFAQIDNFSNRVTNCFLEMGYGKGDHVALMMDNRPEFVGLWLGLSKVGIISVLINTSQRMETLIHSLTVIKCRALIYEPEFANSIRDVINKVKNINPLMEYYIYSDHVIADDNRDIPSEPLHQLLDISSNKYLDTLYDINFGDTLFYIFTSGTTGLPKAAAIRHHRFLWMGALIRSTIGIGLRDNIYITLPLYHTNAGVVGIAQTVLFGTTVTLGRKFSATHFWDDCIRYKCTVAMYIGEICRYLLAQPDKPVDRQHNLRIMFGNGLRQNLWTDFKTRFNIKQIIEFYGSTEGNSGVANITGKVGACGFLPRCIPPWLCQLIFPVVVVKVDPNTREPVRDENGICVPVEMGEIGEIVGVVRGTDPSRAYASYHDSEATAKKIVRNVLAPGDVGYRSGDLMEMDELGYLYFRDRMGDTFRWKGENVSTTEVEAIIQKAVGLTDCAVFGVPIDNCEGKAGMVVIARLPNAPIDMKKLYKTLCHELPSYAVPVFVRLADNIAVTATYKLNKQGLEKIGFDPNVITDELYVLDKICESYVELTHRLYRQIQCGYVLL